MNTLAKLSAYGAALALLTVGAYATGSAVGPLTSPAPATAGHADMSGGSTEDGDAVPETADQPAGLASSMGGYTLTPTDSALTVGTVDDLAFRITGPDGQPVTAFDEEHTKQLHLIVVRRDTSGFQHLHPSMDPDGTWRARLDVPEGGVYRAFADFTPTGGPATTLGMDLSAAGTYNPAAHAPSRTSVVDGFEVRLDGDLTPGAASPLTLTVSRGGTPVSDLQPYLGAYGHLVALRDTDLAYLHVHPDGAPGDGRTPAGPQIRFFAEVPSAGSYRLFLDFQHAGVVRTAEFTVPTAGTAIETPDRPATPGSDDHTHSGSSGGGH